jgi:hypothetical protein
MHYIIDNFFNREAGSKEKGLHLVAQAWEKNHFRKKR